MNLIKTLLLLVMAPIVVAANSLPLDEQILKKSDVFGPQLKPRSTNNNIVTKGDKDKRNLGAVDWSKEVIYFLLIDRFEDGDPSNNTAGVPLSYQKFDGNLKNKTALKYYQGGDLQGVINKLDYIKSLGVTTLWLSPIFENANKDYFGWWPYHGYHPVDLYEVEDHFGNLDLFKKLVSEAHKKNLKVLLDMTYNHAGPEHPFVVEKNNWKKNAFEKWFHPHSEKDDSTSIKNWENQEELETKEVMGLPDFNQDNPQVYDYLLDVSKYWVEQAKVDGFRLDAVKHVGKNFWSKITKDLKGLYGKDFLMLGEVFSGEPTYLAGYQDLGFDSLFDIPLYYTLRQVFAQGSSLLLLSERINKDFALYKKDYLPALLVDNHDVIRFRHLTPDHPEERMKLALTFIHTINGIPVIYYGSEVALEGGSDRDNDTNESTDYLNRRMMPWERVAADEKNPQGIIAHIRKLTNARSGQPALYHGDFLELYKDPTTYVYAKVSDQDISVIGFNASSDERQLVIDLPMKLLAGKKLSLQPTLEPTNKATVQEGKLNLKLKPFSSEIINTPNSDHFHLPANYKIDCAPSHYIASDFVMTTFTFKPSNQPNSIHVAGDFNAWKTDADAMVYNPKEKVWEAKVPLKPGRYLYKMVIDGKTWVPDPASREYEPDPYGSKNSVIIVASPKTTSTTIK